MSKTLRLLIASPFLLFPLLPAVPAVRPIAAPPILFEPNLGQAPAGSGAVYVAQGRGYRLLLEPGAVAFDFGRRQARLDFGRRSASITGESKTQVTRNYHKGDDRRQWFTAVPTYESVRYAGAFAGVDAVFYAKPDLEFDLALAPGADPRSIELRYTGFDSVTIEPDGAIALQTGEGVLRQHVPVVTQDGRTIAARYVRRGRRAAIGIEVARYDPRRPLLIDPKISYATYLGGTGTESANAIAVDSSGNYYLAVSTSSPGYPGLSASQAPAGDFDIVVSKFSANNSLMYTTLIGGSGSDIPFAAVADADGSLYVTFSTGSLNFPRPSGLALGGTGPGSGVLRLNPAGALVSVSTWLGTPNSPANGELNNSPGGVALDAGRNVWMTGTTRGFPAQFGALQRGVGGGRDVFVAKFNNSLSELTYFTYFGTAADEAGHGIGVDQGGSVYVSANTGFGIDGNAYVFKLDPAANRIVFNTTLTAGGGSVPLLLDGADVWVAASATGPGILPPAQALQKTYGGGIVDGALFRVNAADGQVGYATFLGGAGNDFANSLAQDGAGNIIVFGNTTSTNFPTTTDAIQKTPGNPGATTGYVALVDPAGALLYSSYLGGSGTFDIGLAVNADRQGNPILAGNTASTNFPVTTGALQPRIAGTQDVYIARLEFAAPSDPALGRAAVQNAASFRSGAVAPGEIITIYPANAGPSQLATAALTADRHIATLVAGTRVLFDDTPAPIVYTVAGQISVVVPYNVQDKAFTRVVVEAQGVKSRPLLVPVINAAPGVFTISGGAGQAVVVNQDATLNGPSKPAARESIVVFFATGEGQTVPKGEDGRLNEFTKLEDFPRPQASFSVTIGGQPAEVLYGGGAPGFLAGLMQFNVRVPRGVQPGGAVPLVVTVGGVASPASVTMAVQ